MTPETGFFAQNGERIPWGFIEFYKETDFIKLTLAVPPDQVGFEGQFVV